MIVVAAMITLGLDEGGGEHLRHCYADQPLVPSDLRQPPLDALTPVRCPLVLKGI